MENMLASALMNSVVPPKFLHLLLHALLYDNSTEKTTLSFKIDINTLQLIYNNH